MTTDTKAKKNPRGWWLAGSTAEMPANRNRLLPTLEGTVFEQLSYHCPKCGTPPDTRLGLWAEQRDVDDGSEYIPLKVYATCCGVVFDLSFPCEPDGSLETRTMTFLQGD